ncbi:ABC-F family ATP-binding cassette domain-containing protein [Erysipelothrix inopinata]|uniref:ABC-F family ATP-binding cassette domain-containing protein n=1 Tax=Erysipelothrix inopinata TaxID=225084 RepID=A0A7G9S1C0_9FIRM|nr:ABC-F family ATP-binding cassette domain-containing protein [Erysipelothrix inopinata]QNN61645.1 ABC-F family ATP-binding cassette domain-containing protein [Erysipelothrix inopinata]
MKIIIKDLVKIYADEAVLDELSMEIVKGSHCAIVGENGSGKSTLMKILAGIENYQSGHVIIPKEMEIGYMDQQFSQYDKDARSYILKDFETYQYLSKSLKEIELLMSENYTEELGERYAKLMDRFSDIDGYVFENKLESYAKGLGVYPFLDQAYDTLSGGQKTRIALVKLLLEDCEVLCLDEPTNHLDLAGIEWLESYCRNSNKTLIIVSHDRKFLLNTVDVFYEVEDGISICYHGDYHSYREQKKQRFIQLVEDYEIQQQEIKRLRLAIRRYRQWGHESDNPDFFKRAKALEKRIERLETLPKPVELKNQLNFDFKTPSKSSKRIVSGHDLLIGYDTPLTNPLNFEVLSQEHFAISAHNGKGKSTLIKTITGDIEPLGGTLKCGESIKFGIIPQIIEFENESDRLLNYVMKTCTMQEEQARRTLVQFGFYHDVVYKPLTVLSGGERVRLKLLELMLMECQCIILDEPTNHLDIQSSEKLEDVLQHYGGTIIVVSHDRYFLENLKVRTFEL